MKAIYLNFKGVLYKSDIHRPSPAERDFEFAPEFERVLNLADPERLIKIVVDAQLAHDSGLEAATMKLPESLRERVIGMTDKEFAMVSDLASAYTLADSHAQQHGITHWISVNDDFWNWPADKRDKQVLTESMTGFGLQRTQDDFVTKIEALIKA
jgi:hypothetical protein